MTQFFIVLTACSVIGGSFENEKFELLNSKGSLMDIECTKLSKSQDQYSCVFKIKEDGKFLENSSNAKAEIFTFHDAGINGKLLGNETLNQMIHWKKDRVVTHNRSLLDYMSAEKVCIGSIKEIK